MEQNINVEQKFEIMIIICMRECMMSVADRKSQELAVTSSLHNEDNADVVTRSNAQMMWTY